MFNYLGAAQLGLGVMGLGRANSAQREQSRYMREAARVNRLRAGGMEQALRLAQAYDPQAENDRSVRYAGDVAADRLGKALAGVNQQFGAAAGNDTLFNVRAQGAANRVADPLKVWAAQMSSQQTQQKIDAFGRALGMGGDVAGNYMNLAAGQPTDASGAMSMVNSGAQSLFPNLGGNAGTTGSVGSVQNREKTAGGVAKKAARRT